MKSDGKVVIPRNSKLLGRVTEAKARGEGQSESSVGIVFERALLKDGREVPLNVAVQAVAAAEGMTNADAANQDVTGHAASAAGSSSGARATRGGGSGGGLVGSVGSTVGSTAGAATGTVGAVGNPAGAAVNSTTSAATSGSAGPGGALKLNSKAPASSGCKGSGWSPARPTLPAQR